MVNAYASCILNSCDKHPPDTEIDSQHIWKKGIASTSSHEMPISASWLRFSFYIEDYSSKFPFERQEKVEVEQTWTATSLAYKVKTDLQRSDANMSDNA